MENVRLDLMSRESFAALTKADKDLYLQELTARYCRASDLAEVTLDKQALSRLRRFYARRSLAELHLNTYPDNDLGQALRRLAEAMKYSERQGDVLAILKGETAPSPVMRPAPDEDAQFSFFVPSIHDAPLKDDLNLMDVAPFSISKGRRDGTIHYELKDGYITVSGSADVGLATVFDFDIFLHMVSYLADEMRRYRIAEEKGLRPTLPPRDYRPHAAHILKFCRRTSGGRQYKELEGALDRLAGTRIKIVNLTGGKRREAANIPLIQRYKIVSTTTTGHVDMVEIEIPEWVYSGIVNERGTPQILTLHPDYFLISQGIGRAIYRLSRKAAGKNEARYSVAEIRRRSGSLQALPQFTQMLKKFVASTKDEPLPEYDLVLEKGKRGEVLLMRFRSDARAKPSGPDQLPL